MLGLEGYLQALPAAHRPSAREVVGRLELFAIRLWCLKSPAEHPPVPESARSPI